MTDAPDGSAPTTRLPGPSAPDDGVPGNAAPGNSAPDSGAKAVPEPDGDWEPLRAAATAAMRRAYVPYSGYPVGAAALLDDGRLVSGCNVENASLGLTLCAECTMIGALQMGGGGRIRRFYCVDGAGAVLMPCGRCRQLLHEFRAPDMVLMTGHGVKTLAQILPDAFGPDDLDRNPSNPPRP